MFSSGAPIHGREEAHEGVRARDAILHQVRRGAEGAREAAVDAALSPGVIDNI